MRIRRTMVLATTYWLPATKCHLPATGSRADIIHLMQNTANSLVAVVFAFAAGAALLIVGQARPAAQGAPPAPPSTTQTAPQKPTFTVQVDLVTTDVIVRDQRDQFVSDLKVEEFEVLRRRGAAEHRLARADTRRPRVQRAVTAARGRAGGHHPAARPAHQRRRRAACS